MDIKKSLEILELDHPPTPDEAKQAYKDLVNVWHPDRFNENPRLRERAGKKLKEINLAYETVETYLISRETRKTIHADDREGYKDHTSDPESNSRRNQNEDRSEGTTEAAFEAGTFFFLNAWSRLSETVRRFVGEAKKAARDTGSDQGPLSRGSGQGQAQRRGRGGGRGPGMPGGRGRGRGMGPGRGGGRGRAG